MEPRELYGIWCEVWGGVTGSRAAWLKGDNGLRWETTNYNEAQSRAAYLQEQVRNNNRASFSYKVLTIR